MRRSWIMAIVASALAAIASCVGDDPGISGGEGNEGGPCFPNSTCNQGLTCVSTRCVALDGGGGVDGGADVTDTEAGRDGGPDTSSWLSYGAILNTAQVVSDGGSVESGASGRFDAVLDPATGRLCGVVQVINTSGTETLGHLHRGQPGMNGLVHSGGVRVDAGRYVFDTVIAAGDQPALGTTGFYIDVHTTAFGNGEVRGMVTTSGGPVSCP